MFGLPPILAHLVELVSLALISGVAAGVGLRLLGLLRLDSALSIGERLVFAFALGYGLLSYSTFALGLLGLLYASLLAGLLLLLGVVAARPLLMAWREVSPSLRRAIASLRYPPNFFLVLVVLVSIAAALVKALAPPATQDDLMYHLALPARYVQQHGIAFYPDSSYSLFPQALEMLYTVGLLFGSDRLAVLFSFALALPGPIAAALFAKRYLAGDRAGIWRALPLLTVALFLTTPLIGFILRAANTDPAQASFDLLAAYAGWLAIRAISQPPPLGEESFSHSAFILAGIFAGLSLATKYNGFAVGLAIGLALLALLIWRRMSWGVGLRLLLAYGLPIVLLIAPWLVRNYVATGDPVWPLAANVFAASYSTAASSASYLMSNTSSVGLDNLGGGWDFMINAITRPPLLIDNQTQVVSLGPLLLPLLAGLLLAKWQAALRWLAYLATTYWLLWALFYLHTSARYLTSFFLFAALLGAYAVTSLASRSRVLGIAFVASIGISLLVLTLDTALSVANYLPTTTATDSKAEQQYVAKYMEDYPIIQYIATSTPLTATIYVWDSQPRGYYISRSYIYAPLIPLYSDFGDRDVARWHNRLIELGVGYVLYHPRNPLAPGFAPGYDPYAAAEKDFMAAYLGAALFQSNGYTLYPLH